jgi:hypothetical protein
MQINKPTHERSMSNSERDYLEGFLKRAPTGTRRLKEGVENALVLWAVFLLVFVLAWALLAWVGSALFHFDFGWQSPVAIWVLAFGVPACAFLSFVSTVRWIKSWRDPRPMLRADLDGGLVIEEHYQFNAAKRFQEQEHGGLIYFLRTTDDKVLVLFDSESTILRKSEEDPLKSSFKPCTELVMVRAPNTGYVITKAFSGSPLDAGDPLDLLIPPKQWPKSDTWCDIPWGKLDGRLSNPAL